eukprot:7386852-Prymnesium_polylepis.3
MSFTFAVLSSTDLNAASAAVPGIQKMTSLARSVPPGSKSSRCHVALKMRTADERMLSAGEGRGSSALKSISILRIRVAQ